jgi:hypothetical protein
LEGLLDVQACAIFVAAAVVPGDLSGLAVATRDVMNEQELEATVAALSRLRAAAAEVVEMLHDTDVFTGACDVLGLAWVGAAVAETGCGPAARATCEELL